MAVCQALHCIALGCGDQCAPGLSHLSSLEKKKKTGSIFVLLPEHLRTREMTGAGIMHVALLNVNSSCHLLCNLAELSNLLAPLLFTYKIKTVKLHT